MSGFRDTSSKIKKEFELPVFTLLRRLCVLAQHRRGFGTLEVPQGSENINGVVVSFVILTEIFTEFVVVCLDDVNATKLSLYILCGMLLKFLGRWNLKIISCRLFLC